MDTRQTSEDIARLKKEYIVYFKEVPIQRYAAMAVGRDEDTIISWRKNDPDFSVRVNQAKAEWIRKRLIKVKSEFALERLEREVFGPKQSLDVSANKPISITPGAEAIFESILKGSN